MSQLERSIAEGQLVPLQFVGDAGCGRSAGRLTSAHQVLTRHYRAVAEPYAPYADEPFIARKGHLHAERAERDLRARLERGEVPDVLLVSPERSGAAVVGQGGRLADVFAWTPGFSLSNWTHRPFVTAEVHATLTEPDPVSQWYADRGSVLVRDGTLRRLLVPAWMRPVAGQLAQRYGVPVEVEEPDDLPPTPALEAGFVLAKNIFGENQNEVIGRLLLTPRAILPPHGAVDPEFRPPRVVSHPFWEPWGEMVGDFLRQVGDALGLPVNNCEYAVLEYLPGDLFEEHEDRTGDANTWDRTVSFSLLLNEPDEDFGGGQFEIDGEVMRCRQGTSSVSPQ